MYKYRHDFPDDGFYDDRIVIVFRPSMVDMQYLVYTMIPTYIEAFEAYRLEYFDDDLIPILAEQPKVQRNLRYCVDRVGPISFFDDLLCRRAFGLPASAVLDLFSGKIEHAAVVQNGAYLVGSSQVLSFEESEKLSREMRHVLINRSR